MTFAALRNLVQSLNRNKLKHVHAFERNNPTDALYLRLYNGIYDQTFQSADAAAAALFNSDSNDPRYQRLVKKFVRRLTNLVFFIDLQNPQYNDRTRAYYNCYRQFSAIYSIRGIGGRLASFEMMQELLPHAVKYEFTNLCADLTRELCLMVSILHPHKKRLIKHYQTLNEQYEKKRHYEQRALSASTAIRTYFMEHSIRDQQILETLTNYWEELSPFLDEVDSALFYGQVFELGIFLYSAVSDWEKGLAVAERALEVLKSRKSVQRSIIMAFLLNKVTFYTQLRRDAVEEVEALLEEARSITDQPSWLKIEEVSFHYFMNLRQYEAALEVYQRTVQLGLLYNALPAARDLWRLFGGYLQLLGAFNILDAKKVESVVGKLRLTTVVNTEIIGREKEGMNIPVLLLPLLFRLADRKWDTPADVSSEALEKYRQRYLANDLNRRGEAFLRLVQAAELRQHDRATAKRHIRKALDVLAKVPPHMALQWHDIEVIPYEHMWEIIDKHVR